jgi:hypothetical protein
MKKPNGPIDYSPKNDNLFGEGYGGLYPPTGDFWTHDFPIDEVAPILTSMLSGTKNDGSAECDGKAVSAGFGPECSKYKENGTAASAECYYTNILDCINQKSSNKKLCYEQMAELYVTKTASTEAIGARTTVDDCVKSYNKDYDECLVAVKDLCICQDCKDVHNITTPTDPEDPGTGGPILPDDPIPVEKPGNGVIPSPKVRTLSSTSSYGVIPLVFGRYVVPGNIVWISDVRKSSVPYEEKNSKGEIEKRTEYINLIDIQVGLCAGTVQNVTRIWINDILILNRTNNNLGEVTVNLDAFKKFTTARVTPSIFLTEGTRTQKISNFIADSIGFGKVPSSREVSTIVFRNLDVSLFGSGNFPQMTFEVLTEQENQPLVYKTESPTLSNLALNVLSVNSDSERLICGITTTGEHKILNLRDLSLKTAIPNTTGRNSLSTDQNSLFMSSVLKTSVIDHSGVELASLPATFSTGPGVIYAPLASPIATIATDINTDSSLTTTFLVKSLSTEHLLALRYDVNSDKLSFDSRIGLPTTGYSSDYGLFLPLSGVNFSFHFGIHSGSNTLQIRKIKISDVTSEYFSLSSAQLWKTDANPLMRSVYLCYQDNSFIIFLSTNENKYLIKITNAGTVVYCNKISKIMRRHTSVGPRQVPIDGRKLLYISDDNFVVSADLNTGSQEIRYSLSAYSLPNCQGTQFFDAYLTAIYYISNVDTVVGIFPDVVIPQKVTFQKIVNSLLRKLYFPLGILDLSYNGDEEIEGYAIFDNVQLTDILKNISELSLISFSENSGKINYLKRDSTVSLGVFAPEGCLTTSPYVVTNTITSSETSGVIIRYYKTDDTGLVAVSQQVDFSEIEKRKLSIIEIHGDVIFSDLEALKKLERNINYKRLSEKSISISSPPKRLSLAVGDVLTLDNEDYIIVSSVMGILGEQIHHAEKLFVQEYTVSTIGSSYIDRVYQSRGVATFSKNKLLFINAITESDALSGIKSEQIVYSLVKSNDDSFASPKKFYFSFIGDTLKTLYQTSVHSYPAIWGKISAFSISDQNGTAFHSSPRQDFISVTFYSSATALRAENNIINFTDPYAVLSTEGKNTLILGQEILNFTSFNRVGNTITFSGLFRGQQGTEAFVSQPSNGDVIYLYTSDTIRKCSVNVDKTVSGSIAKIIDGTKGLRNAPKYWLTQKSSTGSSRPWAPSLRIPSTVKYKHLKSATLNLTINRRNPIKTLFSPSLGLINNLYASRNFYYKLYPSFTTVSLATLESDFRDKNGVIKLEMASDAEKFSVQINTQNDLISRAPKIAIAQISESRSGVEIIGHIGVYELPFGTFI